MMLRRPRTTKLLTIIAVLAVAAGGASFNAHIRLSLNAGAASAGGTAARKHRGADLSALRRHGDRLQQRAGAQPDHRQPVKISFDQGQQVKKAMCSPQKAIGDQIVAMIKSDEAEQVES